MGGNNAIALGRRGFVAVAAAEASLRADERMMAMYYVNM